MKNKYLAIALVSLAIVAIVAIMAFSLKKDPAGTNQPSLQGTEETAINPDGTSAENKFKDLDPLPADEKQAIDSEIKAIDAELDSLSDESLTDVSGIENEL